MIIEVSMSDYPEPEIPEAGDKLYLVKTLDRDRTFSEIEASHSPYQDGQDSPQVKGQLPYYPFVHADRIALGAVRVLRVLRRRWPVQGQYFKLEIDSV